MYPFAILELFVLWIVWLYPFLRRLFSGDKRQSNVMAPRGKWGLLLQTLGIFFAWCLVPGTPEPSLPRIIASMILAPIGTIFGWLAARHLGKQLRILAGLYPDHELVRTGPYAIVRHPIYLSLFLMMLAAGLLFARWPLLLLGIVLYIGGTEIRIRSEEGLLRSRFGKEFEDYQRRVSAYLPFVR
jgi:protein-S-isoprenylcysteine O-methyltransferase Ste14